MQYLIALCLSLLFVTPVSAQQAPIPRPTADQVNIQILEQEAAQYRKTIGQLAVKVNELTDQVTELTKERDDVKKKCGAQCEKK